MSSTRPSPAHWNANIPLGAGREFDVIRELLDEWGDLAVAIGDDAAILAGTSESMVVSTDACVEGVHFERDWISARDVGVRAATAALSDVAAMGARAHAVLVSFIVPGNWTSDLVQVARGIGDVVRKSGARIVGGNMSAGAQLSITMTVIGRSVSPVQRVGALVGDLLLVTGTLGGPSSAIAAFRAGTAPNPWALDRFRTPSPRIGEGVWLAASGAHAMIDISDGLLADAGHLARASAVDLVLDAAKIPCGPNVSPEQALRSGEEYELLVVMPPDAAHAACSEFVSRFGTAITIIGEVTTASNGGSAVISGFEGEKSGLRVEIQAGYDHFSA